MSSRRTTTFSRRLRASLAAMLVPLVLVAAAHLAIGRSASERHRAASEEVVHQVERVGAARDALHDYEFAALRTLESRADGPAGWLDLHRTDVLDRYADVAGFGEGEERALVAGSLIAFREADRALQAAQGAPAARRWAISRFITALSRADGALGATQRTGLAELGAEAAVLERETRRTFLAQVALMLGAMLGAGLLARRLGRDLHRSLTPLREAARRFGDGELDHRVRMPRDDEFGELGSALNAMAARVTEAHTELFHQARHDGLTGLPNRALLYERIGLAVAQAQRARDERHAGVVLLDLDGFKAVNDTLGHGVGDELLVAVAERLSSVARASDTIARLGGDEFAVLLEDLDDPAEAWAAAERLVRALDAPLAVGGHELTASASAGVAVRPAACAIADELLRDADVAMYRAKGAGKGRHAVFSR